MKLANKISTLVFTTTVIIIPGYGRKQYQLQRRGKYKVYSKIKFGIIARKFKPRRQEYCFYHLAIFSMSAR